MGATIDSNGHASATFPERLTRVLDAINELSKIKSFDGLCRRSLELALDRLGFDRIGLSFLSEDHATVLGVYGTDETGRLRDEHQLRRALEGTPTIKHLLEKGDSVLFFESEILYNDKVEKVGVGNHAVARLWDGEHFIGALAVDNLLHRQPITGDDVKILDVYASALGHLITLKRMEEALRQSEARFRTLFEQATVGVVQFEIANGRILEVNNRFCVILGYTPVEMMDFSILLLTHPRDLKTERECLLRLAGGETHECSTDKRLRRKDGSFVWVNQTLSTLPVTSGGPVHGIAVIHDISERKKMEEQIRTDIREKNILLQEIHHRVKNNMQIIISLLNLQASRIRDPSLLENFTASKDRILSMALVHEMLYQSSDISRIDFKKYVEKLARTLFRSFGTDARRIALELDLQPVHMRINCAIPCGLILQELLSNSLKYAFPADKNRGGRILVGLHRADGQIELCVEDDGEGIPKGMNIDELNSMGFKLVHSLGRDQLGGTVSIRRDQGTRVTLRFKENRQAGDMDSIRDMKTG